MSIAAMFQRKKAFQAELVRPLNAQYADLVRALAAGEEVDEADVFEITDALDISEAQLTKAVAKQQDRFEDARKLAGTRDAQAEHQRLSAEVEKLNAAHDVFLTKWRPKVQAANAAMKIAEQTVLHLQGAEARLRASVFDPEIIERQAALDARRMELHAKRQEIAEQLHEPATQLRAAQARLEAAQSKIKHFDFRDLLTGNPATGLDKRKALDAQADVDSWSSPVRAVSQRLAAVDAQLRSVSQEQSELDHLKLVP